MFPQTTHVVAAPHGFACVVIPAARLYIPSFIEIHSGVSEPQVVKIWPFPLLWLVAFTTACTTVQAVTSRYCIVRKLKQVIKTSISGTNTSLQTFTPLTVCCRECYTSIIHCFSSLYSTDPLLSIAALIFKFCSHMIQICAIQAASYLQGKC